MMKTLHFSNTRFFLGYYMEKGKPVLIKYANNPSDNKSKYSKENKGAMKLFVMNSS